MSADNWATCPQCVARARAEFDAEHARVMALYGSVSIATFDEQRAALKPVNPEDYATFREDYEFYGAEEGEVTADYSGGCGKCGLTCVLQASKRFWEPS